jgi:cytosine/adenosine deaminase-related metal-dependent hydrolase
MTIYRGTVLDTPDSPFDGAGLRAEADAGIAVAGGVIAARGSFTEIRAAHPDDDVVDLTGGLVLPGLVDTHVHYPQVRVIAGLGMPLLDWLDRCALPEEARMVDLDYARAVAGEFVDGLVQAGTTTALVFGAHFAPAVDCLFERAAISGLRISAGLVVADRVLRPDLFVSPEQAHTDGLALGTDVGGGTSFSLLREGLQAYFMQALLGPAGLALTAAHMLYLATRAGAAALDLDEQVGDLSVGKQFDAVWVRPAAGSTLDAVLPHASDAEDALAKVFALSSPADVHGVWVGGDRIR